MGNWAVGQEFNDVFMTSIRIQSQVDLQNVLGCIQKFSEKVVTSIKIQKNFEFFDLYFYGFDVLGAFFKSIKIQSGDTPFKHLVRS